MGDEPSQQSGEVPTDDDTSIRDSEVVYRRIPPRLIEFDEALGRHRPTSNAFDKHPDSRDAFSIFLASELDSVDELLQGHDGYKVVELTVGELRHEGQAIVRVPEEGKGHCHVIGKKSSGTRRRWAKQARWVVGPS